MVINMLGQMAVTVTLDLQQAAILMEALNMATECPGIHELEFRMEQHGQQFTDDGILGHALQAMDLLSKASGLLPFDEEIDGDKAGEGPVEESTTETEDADAKPVSKPN
jgi:hypothetical protein